ncbi:hypothetical protein MJT46_005501 [Ovis ammon polii x Ovis aries]|nr:hypothetical protein MJT46_005501 [Ovis ammon polii x Ovis aries]
MFNSANELEFLEETTAEISQLSSLALSGDPACGENSSTGSPEKTGYPDSVYILAANIFQGTRLEKSPEKALIKYGNKPLPSSTESEDESFQRLSYELAFSALKYQDILETILIDSYIFPSTTIPDHLNSLIIVMLYDFQDRKFQARLLSGNEESIAEVLEVENLLNSPEEVYYTLKKNGYNKVKSVLHIDNKVFAVDQHCYDVLIFPSHLKSDLLNIDLFKDYKLIFQDKSRSLAVHSVKALLNMDDDILMVNTDIEILHETFMKLELKDHRLQKVKVILLLPRCSGLGVSNPVEFILNEHEDTDLLKDFSQGGPSEDKLHVLAQQQYEQLTHAMKFIYFFGCVGLSSCGVGLAAPRHVGSYFPNQRDPSETVSVKDVLARAAAKGLLEGIELGKSSKREKKKKKQKMSLPKSSIADNSGIQMKIAEFLSRETNASANQSETLTTKTSLPGKKTNQFILTVLSIAFQELVMVIISGSIDFFSIMATEIDIKSNVTILGEYYLLQDEYLGLFQL